MAEHRYQSHLEWKGSTAGGYLAYPRAHLAVTSPATTELELSADPHFHGDASRTNPEQLLVMAASSCQLLSFLAVAALHGVDVLDYQDDAVGVMPMSTSPVRITEIRLAPQIRVAAGTDVAAVERLVHEAHEQCYIANSLRSIVTVEPTIARN